MVTMNQQSMTIVRIRCSDGFEGMGEGTTIGGLAYGPESPEGMKLTIDQYIAPLLIGLDATRVQAAMDIVSKAVKGNNFAKCAVESALLDCHALIGSAAVGVIGWSSSRQLADRMDAGVGRYCQGYR